MRADLPGPHLTVQAIHAAVASTFAFGEPKRTHPHLVVCTVPDEQALEDAFEELKRAGIPCCAYREPDMGNAMTAVGTAPLRSHQRKSLRRFRLLK